MRLPVLQSFPIVHLHLDLTNHCNFRCEFCFHHGDLKARRGFMDTALALRLIDEVADQRMATGLATSVFGEALLHPDYALIVAHAVARGLEVTLNTKGGLLDDPTAESIARSGIAKLIISLNAHDEASWSTSHGPPGLAFDRHLGRIIEMIRWKLRTQSRMSIYIYVLNTFFTRPRGIAYLEDDDDARTAIKSWRDACADLASEFGLTPPPPLGDLCRGDIVNRKWLIDRGIRLLDGVELVLKEAHNFGNRILAADLESVPVTEGYCGLPWRMLTVHWNGDCSPCCLDYNRDAVIGNVTHSTLRDVFRGERVTRIRDGFTHQRVEEPLCQTCLGGVRSKTTRAWVVPPSPSSRVGRLRHTLTKYGLGGVLKFGWESVRESFVGR